MTIHEIATRLSDKHGNLWTRAYLANQMDSFTFLLEEGCFKTVDDVKRFIKTRDEAMMERLSND
jgi:hypothetical protein